MPLRNPKWERFAVLVASGAGIADSYEKAGYKRHQQNASRLRKNEQVRRRIDDLLSEQSAQVVQELAENALESAYTRRDAMKESAAALTLALSVEQPGAAVAAVSLRSKLNGLLVDRKEIGGPGAFEGLSDDELRARIAARLQRLGLPAPELREVIDLEVDAEPAKDPATLLEESGEMQTESKS